MKSDRKILDKVIHNAENGNTAAQYLLGKLILLYIDSPEIHMINMIKSLSEIKKS